MNPEKLCSIATFEDDKYDNKNLINQKNNNGIVKLKKSIDYKQIR